MTPSPLDLVVAHLRDRVGRADLLVQAFAEWLGVFDLGTLAVGGTGGLWDAREVAVAGLRESRGRPTSRPFADGFRWLRAREYFRPHLPPAFEADPLAILAVAISARALADAAGRGWIEDIARKASSAESDPWRIALLAAATDDLIAEPDLAVAIARPVDQATRSAAYNLALVLDEPPPERVAVRLAVLTKRTLHDVASVTPSSPSPAGAAARTSETSVKILFLAANPTTTPALSLDEEMRAIDEKIRVSEHRDRIEVVSKWAVRPDDLQLALLQVRPTIVHFSGHGGGTPGIILHGDSMGSDRPVTGDALRHLFETLPGKIRVVLLNACYSADQATAVSDAVDFVIGMKDTVDDETARRFAASFYLGLASAVSVGTAFQLGISSVKLHGLPGDDVPVLHVRSGASADEVLVGSGGS